MATTKQNTTNGLAMKPVDAMPTGNRGRVSMYESALTELAKNPGQPFLVRSCANASAASAGRTALLKAAKAAGIALEAKVSGVDLYAVAKAAGRGKAK